MSNQSNSSVYSEKKIAAYESLFKESSFAKPQEVYLTITVAHIFGQAYIMEQQGTKEGDPVYSRFVCPLEEITKVYINDNVKSSPLFIQCDTDVKGVVHRKRIIVPCLENVSAVVSQIEQVRAQHMEKYNAAQERELNRKREALEAARIKEQTEREAKEKIPPLPAVEKLAEPIPAVSDIKLPEPPAPPKPQKKKAEPAQKSAVKPDISAASSLKEIESLAAKAVEIPIEKPIVTQSKANADEIRAQADISKPVEPVKPVEAAKPIEPAKPVEPVKPKAEEIKPKAPAEKPIEAASASPAAKAPSAPKPSHTKASAPKTAAGSSSVSLEEFQNAVIALKSKLDSGNISAEEFAAQRKKLLATLY